MGVVYHFVEGAGDLATWIGSLGTIGAFIVAFWQIRRERVERHKRDRRERWERLREHADHVTAWVADEQLTVANGSRHLVHEVRITLPDGGQRAFDYIEPGTSRAELDTPVRHGAVSDLCFTDARGHRWQRIGGSAPRLIDDATVAADGTSATDVATS